MKTTLIVFSALWALTVLPLLIFNINKIRIRDKASPKKLNIKMLVIVSVISVLITVIVVLMYNDVIRTRYELATERFFTYQSQYLLGKQDAEDLQKDLDDLLAGDLTTEDITNLIGTSGSANEIQFQMSNWVTPRYFGETFPEAEQIDKENPVYIIVSAKIDGNQTYYLMRMVRQENLSWKFDLMQEATDEQVSAADFASEINGKWLTVK